MQICKRILFIGLSLLLSSNILAGDIRKETFLYAVKGADSLYFDKYELTENKQNKPCLIFMFGGGFVAGTRDRKSYIPFFEQITKAGYSVVSIDYRLGLKSLDASKLEGPTDIIPVLDRTIQHTVEDLYDVTNYILAHCEKWHIDKDAIVLSGSSAGAISVLQAEYELCNEAQISKRLPIDFRYAGIVSFAGAILSMDGDLVWKRKPCPIQLFHGDADGNVPYDKIEFFNVGFYGSKHIVSQLQEMSLPYYFYDAENHTHEIADSPMAQNIPEVISFLNLYVKGKQKFAIHNKVQLIGRPVRKKNYSILNYITNNF